VSRPFYQATAEQVVLVSEAIVSLGNSNANSVATFTDLPQDIAESALNLSVDLGLLSILSGEYGVLSPLCKLLRTPQDREKAAILRVLLESYEPLQVFREEHHATKNVTEAARRTKTKLDLDCHREDVKATLLSLSTFSGVLTLSQGNDYIQETDGLTALLDELVAGSREIADATKTIHVELGASAYQVDHALVIEPLVAGLRHAVAGAGREAVLQGGIAVENHLNETALHHGVNVVRANGVNAKMDLLLAANHYPPKLSNVCKYLGHIRNAADHGADRDIQAMWDITPQTGRNYIFVAAMFIRSTLSHRSGTHEI
jgi:hypothetical protein